MKKIFLLFTTFVANADPITISDGLILELNKPSYEIIAEEIRKEGLKDINRERIPDFERDLGKGIRFETKGLYYSVKFVNLTLTPTDKYIIAKIEVKDIHLQSDRFDFIKRFEEATLRAECVNTNVYIGRSRPTPLTIELNLTVENNKIVSDFKGIDTSIPADDFDVHGPSSCSGPLGVGHLIKEVVQEMIPRLRPQMESALYRAVKKMEPQIGDIMNEKLIRGFKLGLNPSPFLQRSNFQLLPVPSKVQMGNNRTTFTFNLDLTADESEFEHNLISTENYLESLASFKLHPDVLNSFIQLGLNPNELEIDEKIMPKIRQSLTRRNLFAIWPELLNLFISESYLKAFLQFSKLPTIALVNNQLVANIPEVGIYLQVNKQKKWRDFFDYQGQISAPVAIIVDDEKISFKIDNVPTYKLQGSWNKAYRPVISTYNEKPLMNKVAEAVQKLNQKNLFSFKNLRLEIANQVLTIENILVQDGYLTVNLKANPKPSI